MAQWEKILWAVGVAVAWTVIPGTERALAARRKCSFAGRLPQCWWWWGRAAALWGGLRAGLWRHIHTVMPRPRRPEMPDDLLDVEHALSFSHRLAVQVE